MQEIDQADPNWPLDWTRKGVDCRLYIFEYDLCHTFISLFIAPWVANICYKILLRRYVIEITPKTHGYMARAAEPLPSRVVVD